MDASTALVFVSVAAVALACQAVDPDQPRAEPVMAGVEGEPPARWSGTRVMRAAVVVLVVYLLLNGLIDLAAGLGDDALRKNLGLSGSGSDLLAEGALVTGSSVLSLFLFHRGIRFIPGLRGLRARAPISWLALALFLYALAANLAPSTAVAAVASTIAHPENASDLIIGGLPFAVIGVAAVGPGVRRNAVATLRRLGLLPVSPPWWMLGLAVGVLLIPAADHLVPFLDRVNPTDCRIQQGQVLQSLGGQMRTPLEQVGIALSAGICEELLFRGALQPRIGILLSTALWASFHLQYTCHGLPAAPQLVIVCLGFVFGGLRRWGGLWAAIIAHVAYDATILLDASPAVQGVLIVAGGGAAIAAFALPGPWPRSLGTYLCGETRAFRPY